MKTPLNPRIAATNILFDIFENGVSLAQGTAPFFHEKPFVLQLCYGTLRHYYELSDLLKQLMPKPLRNKERIIEFVLLIGLYQLRYLRVPPHAAVTETVDVVNALKKSWAKALVNGVLRAYLRQQETLTLQQTPEVMYNHPLWLINMFKQAWPEDWQTLLAANQQPGPMTLRVNLQRVSREHYLTLLAEKNIAAVAHPAITSAVQLIEPCDVMQLPGFATGWVSVQDLAAQLCGFILPITPQARVLDACAAPGGKACHLLEQQPHLQLTAIDISEARQQRTQENLTRLQLSATLLHADAAELSQWWDGELFDAILLDAPCSATGVIRRHPDIKFLKRPDDFKSLPKTQLNLLQQLWKTLKTGGHLLYVTCSVMPEENDQVLQSFIGQQPEAVIVPLNLPIGKKTRLGWQILPGQNVVENSVGTADGFYYCLLRK